MGESWHRGDWMETFTGRKFYPFDPQPEDVDPVDIAHALGMLCRYNGHVRRFYSVAEHCVLMSQTFEDRELALWALLHDATEAYVGDMIRPLKRSMRQYRLHETTVMFAIAERFGLPRESVHDVSLPPVVKDADNRILLTERRALMRDTGNEWDVDSLEPLDVKVRGLAPLDAKIEYLGRLRDLGVDVDWTKVPS